MFQINMMCTVKIFFDKRKFLTNNDSQDFKLQQNLLCLNKCRVEILVRIFLFCKEIE